jgi:hypothetical protein
MKPDNPPPHREPGPVGRRIHMLLSRAQSLIWWRFRWNQVGNAEGRNPKTERNPKAEARRKLLPLGHRNSVTQKDLARQVQLPPRRPFSIGVWPVRISVFGLLSDFGLRVSGFNASFLLLASLFSLTLTSGAAVPAPEQLLPDDTLIMVTAPDFAKLKAICRKSPKSQLWNDPAMKPLRDKFESRWQEEVVKPIARDLNVSLDSYASLPQGQLTFAVTKGAWQGKDDQPLGFLLLLDAKDKTGLLKTTLAVFRKQWVGAGKTFKTETIRNVEFSVFPFTTNDVPKSLSQFLWRPPVFAQVSSGPDIQQAPTPPSRKPDLLLDTLRALLAASKELVIGQVDSLLVVGNSVKDVEKVVVRLTGGAMPTLGDLAAYQASHQACFRDAPLYGWVNVKAFADTLGRKSSESQPADPSDPLEPLKPDKIISATGLAGCRALAFSLQDSNEGSLFQLFLSVPEATREGLFQVLTGAPKEAGPPPFVPADAVRFFRWRLDGTKTWATIEKMLNEVSPQSLGVVNLILDTANARARLTDPGFDLKKTLLASLGDDFIRYEKAPRGNTPAELESPPSLILLGSPNPEQLAVALKRLFVIFPQGDAPAEREFLGRKIFSVPVPPLPFPLTGPSQPRLPSTLSCAASGSYVAMSTDAAMLEEYLRSSESQAKALRDKPGLLEAAQKVGGMGTGLFGYENELDTKRAAFEAVKNEPASSTNGIGPSVFPGLPGITGPEKNLSDWMDFSLLPAFDKVSQYFYFDVYAGSANVDGLTLKEYSPLPPALRGNSPATPGK